MADVPIRIGQFEVLRQLGTGGMGAVYLGRDVELDRQVAIKVIREEVHDQEVLDRFFREARAAAALRHPNIITIYASGQHEHKPYMVMEYVDGESLADLIKNKRSLSLSQKLSYLEQICAGLYVAHRAGIVHRDIKPANVMIDRDGVVRILDFGIARVEGSGLTQDGTLMGSLNYMSPEQMLGRTIDHRSDIFSVGSLAYELITYQQAFKGSLNDGLLQRLPYQDPPPLNDEAPDTPWAVEEIIMKALQKQPEDRYQDLSQMRTALVSVMQTPPFSTSRLKAGDDRTMVLTRGPGSPAGAPVGPQTPPSQFMPPPAGPVTPPSQFMPPPAGPVTPSSQFMPSPAGPPPNLPPPPPAFSTAPPPPAFSTAPPPSAFATPPPATSFGAPRTATGAVPASPTWSIKKKPEAPPPRVRTSIEVRPSTSTPKAPVPTSRPAMGRPATDRPATDRPATTRPPTTPTVAAPASSSRRWVLIGAAVAVVGGAAVAIPMLTGPDVPPLERERPAIQAAMEQYRIAYRNRDLRAVGAAFPALPKGLRQTMETTFTDCLVYEVVFDGVTVQLAASSETQAEVALRSTHTCTPQSGAPQTTNTQDETYTLQKNGNDWLITGVKKAN